jgi:hypothetical protein
MNDFVRYFLPYCLDLRPDGSWLVLNRANMPLGRTAHDKVAYAIHPARIKIKGLTLAVARKLSGSAIIEKSVPERIYLYDDRSAPTRGAGAMWLYFRKLMLLASLEVTLVEAATD